MENHCRCQGDLIHEKNKSEPDIITLNTKDNYARPPTGAPVSDEKSSVHYSLGHSLTESERDFVSGHADDGPSNYLSPASKIPLRSHPSPPNTS